MARTKLTDKQKKKIIADYVANQNFSETARMNNVHKSTVKRLIDNGYDKDFQQKATEKRQEDSLTTIEYMQTQHETKKRVLDKILKAIEQKADNIDMFTNIKDLATAYGIILDKELKVLELQRGNANHEELSKVKELLTKLEDEANK